jgi:hypothetical protein
MRVPWAYVRLTQAWGLSCPQARQLWQALAQSRSPAAATWRDALWQCEGRPGIPLATLLAQWSPREVLTVLDTLRGARQLSRVTRVQVEESVLREVDRTGGWKALPAAGGPAGACGSDLASIIEQYWR